MSDLVTRLRNAMADEALRLSELPPWPWKLNAEGDEILAADDEEICTGWALSSRQQRAVAAYIVDQDPQAKLRRITVDRKILDHIAGELADDPSDDAATYLLETLAEAYGVED